VSNQQGRGGGSSKIGRNKVKCDRYRLSGRRITNKVRRLAKHLRVHTNDKVAEQALANIDTRR
jgi:ribosomal protein S15P/S13E